jgi:hypothetical protein
MERRRPLLCFSGTYPARLIPRNVVRYNVLSSSFLTVV